MGFYAAQSYTDLPADNPSLIVAWCHLLYNFGKDVDPATLAEYLSDFTDEPDWHTISAYDPEITVSTSGGNAWPTSRNAIVNFRILGSDGNARNHYCLIFDPENKTIIDSADGQIKNAGVYGNPASFGSYSYNPQTTEAEPTPTIAAPAAPGRLYTVLKGERIYDISRKLHIPESELIEHNDIKDPYNLPEGYQLRLPVAIQVDKPQPTYQVYDTPQQMHISRSGGAQKWFFGNVNSIKDIISGSGMYPENKELQVAGAVTVPVEGETFAYYLDELALGDYVKSGKVRYTIGFAHGDLTVGPAPVSLPDEPAPPIVEQIQATLAAIEPDEPKRRSKQPIVLAQPPHDIPPRPVDESLPNPNQWKSTYTPFENPVTYIVDLPNGEEMILVEDQDAKKPARKLRDTGHYLIAGTFWKNGVEYLRPFQAVQGPREHHNWYGIPAQSAKTEAEMYNAQLDLPTKVALHHSSLTPVERYVVPRLAFTALSYDRLKLYGKKIKHKTKEILQ